MITAQSAMKRANDCNDARYTNCFCDLDQTIKRHADKGEYECTFKIVDPVPTKILNKLYSVLIDCGFKIKEPYHTGQYFCIDISWDLKEENKPEDPPFYEKEEYEFEPGRVFHNMIAENP